MEHSSIYLLTPYRCSDLMQQLTNLRHINLKSTGILKEPDWYENISALAMLGKSDISTDHFEFDCVQSAVLTMSY